MAVSELEFSREVERNYRHNFWFNLLDGTFFWGGAALIAPSTILPVFVSYLSDSGVVIGLLSMISTAGWFVPQLFTANWVQRLPRKKVLPVNLGLFTERLPVPLMVVAALLAGRYPSLALVVFLLLVTWHSVGAGIVAVAWQDMIAKIIPADRRGKFFGVTNFLGTATGVAGASAAAWLLGRYGFPGGYVRSFALAALLILISWAFLAQTREPALENQSPPVSQREYLRRLPAVLRADTNFGRFLLSRVIMSFGGMATGFVAIYAIGRWRLPDGQAGLYTASMLVGQAASNLWFGPLADRRGHKLVLELSTLLGMAGIGLAALAPGAIWFYLVFALLGAHSAGMMLSGLMIALEFGPAEVRPTYIGLNNTVHGTAAALAPILGGGLSEALGYRPLFGLAFAVGMVGLLLLRWSVRDPRQWRAGDLAAETSSG